jgi:hypothetical protein
MITFSPLRTLDSKLFCTSYEVLEVKSELKKIRLLVQARL